MLSFPILVMGSHLGQWHILKNSKSASNELNVDAYTQNTTSFTQIL
jgi:hypothetical protein